MVLFLRTLMNLLRSDVVCKYNNLPNTKSIVLQQKLLFKVKPSSGKL